MAHRVAAPKLGLKFSTLDAFHDTVLQPGMKLGQFTEDYAGNGWQLFLLADAVTAVGDVLYVKSYTAMTVTPTIGNSAAGEVAGIATAIYAIGDYVWLRKRGLFNTKANGIFARGTAVWPDSGNNRVVPAGVFNGSLSAAADTAGAILGVTNPLTGAWRVTSLVINRTTKSTGAGTADFGIAANATTLNDGLIDGLDLNTAAANNENNFINAGTNGKASQLGAAGTVLTGSTASGAVAGLVGTYSGTFEPVGAASIVQLKPIGIAQAAISAGKVSLALDIPYIG